MYSIIELSKEQADGIDESLEQFELEHIGYHSEGRMSLGIEEDGKLIAGFNAYYSCYRILYLATLFVDKEYRRRGIGRMLVTEMERRAGENGVGLIRVDSFDWQGRDFYRALGYETVGSYRYEKEGFEEAFFIKRL